MEDSSKKNGPPAWIQAASKSALADGRRQPWKSSSALGESQANYDKVVDKVKDPDVIKTGTLSA